MEACKRVVKRLLHQQLDGAASGEPVAVWLAHSLVPFQLIALAQLLQRQAPARVVIDDLVALGARVQAYDPVAMPEAKKTMADIAGLSFADSPMAALQGADVLAIITEWKEFRSPDFAAIRAALKRPVIIDGRNLYDPAVVVAEGLEYHPIGRPVARPADA